MHTSSFSNLQNDLLIVVPFRNEKVNIPFIIDCLKNQKLSAKDRCVLIDDHSTDDLDLNAHLNNVIQLTKFNVEDGYGKKAALSKGINTGKENLILTTDADCSFSEHWSEKMRVAINTEKQFIIGPVLCEKSSNVITSLQEIESIVMLHLAKLSASFKTPIICWGANLLFTRQVFESVNGYDSHSKKSSGDDVLLMRAVLNKFPNSVFFNNDYDALVTTKFVTSWNQYFSQRMRWASKSAHLNSVKAFLLTFSLFVLLFMPYMLLVKFWFIAVLIPFVEYFYLLKTAHFYRRNFYVGEWFFFRMVYPTLVLTIIALSLLPIKVKWKEREINF